MSADESSAPNETVVSSGTSDELDRLRAENERLKSDAAAREAHRATGWRWTGAIILMLIGLVLFGLAVPTLWLNRTIMNTDRWVATVGPLADNAAIQNALADKVSTALFARVDVEGEIRSILPTALAPIAAPVAAQIETYADKLITEVVRSDQFSKVWNETVRATQEAFVAAVTGGGPKGAVSTQNGVITLYTAPFVQAAQDRLAQTKISGISKFIPWSKVPQSFVLYESQGLARAQTVFGVFNQLVWILPLSAILFLGLSLWAAPVTRRAWLWIGIGLIVVTLLPFEALVFGRAAFVNAAYSAASIPNDAAQAFWDILFRFLVNAQRAAIALGLVITVAAFMAGPSKVALWFRHGIAHGMTRAGGGASFGKFGEFVAANKGALRIVAVVLGVVVALLSTPLTPAFVIGDAIFIAVAILLIEFFGQGGSERAESAGAGTTSSGASAGPSEGGDAAGQAGDAPADTPANPTSGVT